jgi:hypothetical protein
VSCVYTLTFGEDIASAPDERLAAVGEVAARVGAADADALIVLSAGFVQAPTLKLRDRWADGLRATSRAADLAIVFGLDVADGEKSGVECCPRSFAYACDRGQRLLWGAATAFGRNPWAQRAVTFGCYRTVVLLGREVFHPGARRFVEEKRPDLTLVLGHARPTARWLPALTALDAHAPTLMVHQALRVRRPVWTGPPRGFTATVTEGPIRVAAYRREAAGTPMRAVGD